MVDPTDPTSGTAANPVMIQRAPLEWHAALWEWVKAQGFTIAAMAIAVVFLWNSMQADRKTFIENQSANEARNATTLKATVEQHAVTVEKLAAQQTKQLNDQAAIFTAEQARTERLLGRRIDRQGEHIAEVAKKVDEAMPK